MLPLFPQLGALGLDITIVEDFLQSILSECHISEHVGKNKTPWYEILAALCNELKTSSFDHVLIRVHKNYVNLGDNVMNLYFLNYHSLNLSLMGRERAE